MYFVLSDLRALISLELGLAGGFALNLKKVIV